MTGGGPGSATVANPTVLGKLTLLGQIGEGGMARIFLARARGIGGFEKLVVVKQILPRLAEDAEFIARFFQEARLAATLDHPNIATVYDVDQERGAYFYSMEYVRGRDLHKVMRRAQQVGRPLSLDEIVAIVGGLCAGLHHAHTRLGPDGRPLGIVHRDVSPSNVLLSFEGAVKLADFGVAKARTGMVATDAGTLRGKIGYMAPEQCRGEALDRRSDVYAVGVLLWELLAGQRLHQGESEVAIIHRIAREEAPSPREHRPELSVDLEHIVARALAREPSRRFASAHALQAELEEHARQLKLATSARTIAALMRDLFGEEEANEQLTRSPMTEPVHAAGPATPHDERNTLPTETVAPRVASRLTPLPTVTRDRRTPWAGVGLGLTMGMLLGGGGLWLASSSDEPPPAASDARGSGAAVVPAAAASLPQPAAASPPPAAALPEPTPAAPVVEGERHDDDAPAQPSTKRRKARRRPRSSASPPALDLDSPLPPGSGAG